MTNRNTWITSAKTCLLKNSGDIMNDRKKIINEPQAMWLVTIVLLIINFVFYKFRIGGTEMLTLAGDLFPVICSLFAAGALFRITFYLKSWDLTKTAWLLLAFGLFFWFLGESSFAVTELALGRTPGVPSLGDGFWLCGIFPIITALILLIYGYHRTGFFIGNTAKYIFVIIAMSVLEIVLIAKVCIPILYAPQLSVLEKIFTLVYPVLDMVILLLVFFLVLITSVLGKGLLSKPWKYLAIGFALNAVADILYSYYNWLGAYSTGSYIDLMWNCGYLFIALSAFYQKDLMERF
jgi:hypothetical protein